MRKSIINNHFVADLGFLLCTIFGMFVDGDFGDQFRVQITALDDLGVTQEVAAFIAYCVYNFMVGRTRTYWSQPYQE